MLENGVRGHRRAVADLLDRAAGEARLAEHLGEALDDRLRIVLDARGDLLAADRAVGAEQHDVGEGAADVDTDAIACHCAQAAFLALRSGSSRCTAAGSRSSGSPQPPAPARTWRNTSPFLMVMVNLLGSVRFSPSGLR